MLTYDELYTWDEERLLKQAEEYGIPNPIIQDGNREKVVLDILDVDAVKIAKEVVNSSRKRKGAKPAEGEAEEGQPKKRGRKSKSKAENPENAESENKPEKEKKTSKKGKGTSKKAVSTPESSSETSDTSSASETSAAQSAPAPKKRGRKSKAELAAIQAQKEAEAMASQASKEGEEAPATAEAPLSEEQQPKKRGRKPGAKKTANQDNNLPAVVNPSANLPMEIDRLPESAQPEQTQEDSQKGDPQSEQQVENRKPENKQPQKNQQKKRDFQNHKDDGFSSFFGNSKGRTFKPRNAQEQHEPALFDTQEGVAVQENQTDLTSSLLGDSKIHHLIFRHIVIF